MFSFIKSVFSEDGQGSYSRVFSGIIVASTLGWVTHIVWRTHQLPDLGNPSLFITAGVGSHYGINKLNDVVDSIRGNK